MKIKIIIAFALLLSCSALAENNIKTVGTNIKFFKIRGLGHQHASKVIDILGLIKKKKYDIALKKIEIVLPKYTQLIDPNKPFFTFRNKSEYLEFSSKQNASKIQWVDWSYKECIQLKAHIKSSVGKYKEAYEILNLVNKLAPVSAQSYIEKGYVLTKMNKLDDSLKSYKQALKLTYEYTSQKVFRASALRGLSFVYLELNDLDRAETLLQKSLRLEPKNRSALNELEFIADLRRKK